MLNRKSLHVTLAVVVTAAVILVAGGAAIASNAGFKMNMYIRPFAAGQVSPVGNNWVSLPYFNPYVTVNGLCAQTGLSSGIVNKATVTTLDPATGNFNPQQCNTAGGGGAGGVLIPGRAYQIRQPAAVTPPPFSIIVVGSHNPALQIHLEDLVGQGPVGSNWISVPYHTTAVTYEDFCDSAGLSQTIAARATLTQWDPDLGAGPGTFVSQLCGTPGSGTTNLVLGRALRIWEPNGPKDFIPAHY
jgi:hypothetical protein